MSKTISYYIREFIKKRDKTHRYASFDYCYNYFYGFYKDDNIKGISDPENIQLSCLHLGYYLASWGMMRGSSFLLQRNSKYLENLIEEISNFPKRYWEIDVEDYLIVDNKLDNKNNKIKGEQINNDIFDIKDTIIDSLKIKVENKEKKPTATLITKIMLGVFANIPAYDQYFKKGMGGGFNQLNKKSLENISDFYYNNKNEIDKIYEEQPIYTLDFAGNETEIKYTKAKLIDMYGFTKGMEL